MYRTKLVRTTCVLHHNYVHGMHYTIQTKYILQAAMYSLTTAPYFDFMGY